MDQNSQVRLWQRITVGTLFTGYAGYYICRSNLSVATPLLLTEFAPIGLTKAHIGDIATFGVLFYALGKLVNGILTEYLGGKAMFVGGMVCSILATIAFVQVGALDGPWEQIATRLGYAMPMVIPLAGVWAVNRFVQSMGWGGLVQIAAQWYPASRLATVMGILSMSYLLGDALARLYLGAIVEAGAGWRGVFYASAGTLFVIAILVAILLRSSPKSLGLPVPPPPPDNVWQCDHIGKVAAPRTVGPATFEPTLLDRVRLKRRADVHSRDDEPLESDHFEGSREPQRRRRGHDQPDLPVGRRGGRALGRLDRRSLGGQV